MDCIKGKIKNYVFHNDENSYSIARIITDENRMYTIVGYFPVVSEDINYEFCGSWVKHNTYGEQLKVESFKKCEEQSRSGLKSN
jgi:exodeoxyribonuclease V alpha subunit